MNISPSDYAFAGDVMQQALDIYVVLSRALIAAFLSSKIYTEISHNVCRIMLLALHIATNKNAQWYLQ